METLCTSALPRRRSRRSFTGRAPLRAAALIAGAVCLGGVSPVLAAPAADPVVATPGSASPAAPSRAIAPDRSTQPQAGETAIQIPDPASDREVSGQYGLGVFLLVLGGLISAAFVVALFRIVVRHSWDSTHAPASRR